MNYDFESLLDKLPCKFTLRELMESVSISDDEAIRLSYRQVHTHTDLVEVGKMVHALDVVKILKDLGLIVDDLEHDDHIVRYKKL